MTSRRHILTLIATLLMLAPMAQAQLSMPQHTIDPNATLIYLEHCQTLNYDENNYPGAQLLTGDVLFRHDSALMYCDSAYFYQEANSIDAFGNIRFEQGDTLFGYGDILYYNGNTKLARIRNNVRLVHYNTTLTTDSLNYDRIADLAYYFNNGTINDSLNTLTSVYGQYTPANNQATFKDSVHLQNPNFTLSSDTLLYNTATHIANIVSPTTIIYQEETTILSSRGQYNTQNEQSVLLDKSRVNHNDGKQLTGDSILYDKINGIGNIYGHMELTDTINQLTLYGNYGEYHEQQSTGFATDSALAIDRSDTIWLYIHADTLFTQPDSLTITTLVKRDSILIDSVLTAQPPDTITTDTAYQLLKGFHNVRIYRNDLQATCDSMAYSEKDSLLRLYYNPIAWSDTSQLSADSIHVQMANDEPVQANCYGSAIAIMQEDIEFFNQLSGKEIIAHIKDGELYRIDVDGNAQTVFFPREDTEDPNQQGEIVGVNMTLSSYVKLYIKNQKVERVLFTTATNGTTYPLDELSTQQMQLPTFFWAQQERPVSPDDVFRKTEPTPRPDAKSQSATDMPIAPAAQTTNSRQNNNSNKSTGGRRVSSAN